MVKPFADVTVNIFGCCVSRDIFAMHEDEILFKVCQYQGLVNPVSYITQPFCEDSIKFNDGSNFGNRMVNLELTKKWKEYFEEHISDYIVIDIADARVQLIKQNDTLITNSLCIKAVWQELIAKNIISNDTKRVEYSDLPLETYKNAIDAIFSYFIARYNNKIIFIKLYNSDFYITHDNKVMKFNNLKCSEENAFLQKLYDYIEYKYNITYILSSPKISLASQTHKFGLSPLHYVKEYYDVFYEQLKCIINPNNDMPTKLHQIEALNSRFTDINRDYLSLCLPESKEYHTGQLVSGYANIAPLGKARQSSISIWSQGNDEAKCALTGKLKENEDHAFHTNFEPLAWWMVDLQDYYKIRMVKLINRDTYRERYTAEKLEILFSLDSKSWSDWGHPQLVENGDAYVLKIDGYLYRFVKVQIHHMALHFKQICIYI